jgi:acyl-CoA thioester hydrolase
LGGSHREIFQARLMPKSPLVFRSKLRVTFADLDPYNHVGTALYARYFIDHRMNGLRDYLGWDLKTLAQLPFMTWVKRMEIDYLNPALADQELTISSFVREIKGSDAFIECVMSDEAGRDISRCIMVVACVDKRTNSSMDWPGEATALFFHDGQPRAEE